MSKILKAFLLLIGLAIAISLTLIAFDYFQSETRDERNSTDTQNTGSQEENIIPTPLEDLTTSAWIPYWDYSRGLTTLKNNPGRFDSILPVIYELNTDGSLKMTKGRAWEELQEYSENNGIEFIPSIAMFDHEIFTEVLQNEENFNRHIEAIIREVEQNNFDGIDLDYESTKKDDEAKYREFIQKLSEKLHSKDKKLVVTVLPKWLPDFIYPSLNETRAVQDWEFLGEYADEVRIMAYDYTSQQSEKPGPIAPAYWVETILKKARREIPPEKIILGLNSYGYNWAANQIDPEVDFMNNPPTGKVQADAYTYDEIQRIKEQFDGKEYLYEDWQEMVLEYKREGNERILIFATPETVQKRIELASWYGIKGVSFWRLGGDAEFAY
ncbi:hypothetical protein JW978_02840 [Candidatus Dojkabacteria bacterium]|nr:hypothetical protein [Candidatus Dojkabacteria bacterium]